MKLGDLVIGINCNLKQLILAIAGVLEYLWHFQQHASSLHANYTMLPLNKLVTAVTAAPLTARHPKHHFCLIYLHLC